MITIPIHNRFDHTNLRNIQAIIVTGKQKKVLPLPDVAPHAMGTIILPASSADSTVLVQFKDSKGALIDEELISWRTAPLKPLVPSKDSLWSIENKEDQTLLKSGNILISINTKTGTISQAMVAGQLVITGNPLLVVNRPLNAGVLKNTDGIFSGDYKINSFSFDEKNREVFIITSKGLVDTYPVAMTTALYPNGQMTITYSADSIPAYTWDIGVGIPVTTAFDKISWNRKGYWSTYPKGHVSALTGSAAKRTNSKEVYGLRPGFEVAQSMRDFILTKGKEALYRVDLPSTEIYRAKKENIYSYTVSGGKTAISVFSDGKHAAKMNVQKDGSQQLLVSDKWDYWTLSWGITRVRATGVKK
ncbi:DUF4981 domain-containing protein [Niabella hibiscisoli]|uniref:DUF4981 domain-containing protein n=1 Tax=Niabella hibiscisoli TaxID=1825928 RepID=UPI001F0CECB4|nr:DUF4981 domain-containing protein [Niabella hibiscisoli]MCH5719250.1 DUF4981 domain-containing protein [Niabella hibiscisoli]